MRRAARSANPVVGLVLGLLMSVAFVGLPWWFFSQSQPYGGGRTVRGEVVRLTRSHSSKGGTTCEPVVRYSVDEQSYVSSTSYSSSGLCDVGVGTLVDVSYRPDRPADGRPLFPASKWLWVFVAVGVFLGPLSIRTFVRARRGQTLPGSSASPPPHIRDPGARTLGPYAAYTPPPPLGPYAAYPPPPPLAPHPGPPVGDHLPPPPRASAEP